MPFAWLLLPLLASVAHAQRCWVDGAWSSCSTFQECPTAVSAIWERNVIPPLCRVVGDNPVICCPLDEADRDVEVLTTQRSMNVSEDTPMGGSPTTTMKPPMRTTKKPKEEEEPSRGGLTISSLKCREYSAEVFSRQPATIWAGHHGWVKKTDTCFARRITRVVGGVNARPKEFPHLVLVGYGDLAPVMLCGGTLISRRYVLTAAHCCHQHHWGAPRWIRVGELDTSTHLDYADPTDYAAESCITHPQWDSKSLYHDLALIKLGHEVKFSPFVRPACLPSPGPITERHAVAAGWGRTSFGEEFSSHLRKVLLEVIDTEICNSSFAENIGMFGHIPMGINRTTQLCVAAPHGQDTCQGDSALQQLLVEPYCMYQVIGVLSFGKYCGSGHPTVYTRVSHYVPWIESVVWNKADD